MGINLFSFFCKFVVGHCLLVLLRAMFITCIEKIEKIKPGLRMASGMAKLIPGGQNFSQIDSLDAEIFPADCRCNVTPIICWSIICAKKCKCLADPRFCKSVSHDCVCSIISPGACKIKKHAEDNDPSRDDPANIFLVLGHPFQRIIDR